MAGTTGSARAAWVLVVSVSVLIVAPPSFGAKPQPPTCQITQAVPTPNLSADPDCDAAVCTGAGGSVAFTGTASGGSTPYAILWEFPGGDPFEVAGSIATSGGSTTASTLYAAAGSFTATFNATDSSARALKCKASTTVKVIGGTAPQGKSINSTSQNATAAAPEQVPEQPLSTLADFAVLTTNDLGMHCADLDYQVFSILPPFNVVHAQVVRRGTGSTAGTLPMILDNTNVDVVYSAASSPLDPALGNPTNEPIFKTNFWDPMPGTSIPWGIAAYDPLYPAGVLTSPPFSFDPDWGLPVPDVVELYLGSGALVAGQQRMPGVNGPYALNQPQHFDRFDPDYPFFVNFPFGYTVNGSRWFAADGVPVMPVDDQGRSNAYPLMRIQAVDRTGNLTGTPGTVLASTDTVLPVASEADCQICHADQSVCTPIGQVCDGIAASFASVYRPGHGTRCDHRAAGAERGQDQYSASA